MLELLAVLEGALLVLNDVDSRVAEEGVELRGFGDGGLQGLEEEGADVWGDADGDGELERINADIWVGRVLAYGFYSREVDFEGI